MIRKVAVIGGGPAGLATVFNHLEANKKSEFPIECVGFEARSELGGVWSDTPGKLCEEYPSTFERLGLLTDERLVSNDRRLFYDKSPLVNSDGQTINLKGLSGTSHSRPLKLKRQKNLAREGIFFTNKTGLYENFFGNVPDQLMRLEVTPVSDPDFESKNCSLSPLIDLKRIKDHLNRFIKENDLPRHFRVNTSVEYVDKFGPDGWIIAARRAIPGKDYDDWYLEKFDAVVICTGHFLMPYVPLYMSRPNAQVIGEGSIHEYNIKYPGNLVHVRDIDSWNHRVFPTLTQAGKYRKIVIVGKSFSCMDVLKKVIELHDSIGLKIYVSTDVKPAPDDTKNPFYWFDVWLSQTKKVQLKPEISRFISETAVPSVEFVDGTTIDGVDSVIFATGYIYSFPFISEKLLSNCKIFVTPDPRNSDGAPSNISRVTGLYLHTFSIAEPTFTFCGVSSNANFQSFHISAKAIVGVFTKFNTLYNKQKPRDSPYYDSIWQQLLPPINEQLEWSKKRLSKTGNNGAFHFYYPLPSLKQDWLAPCQKLFYRSDQCDDLFPENSEKLSKDGIDKLRDIFLEAMK